MKKLILLSLFAFTSVAHAHTGKLVAQCTATDGSMNLCVYDSSSGPNWTSIDVEWSPTCGGCECGPTDRIYLRQFVNSDVKQNDADGISAKQNHGFLGLFGNKTKFELDKKSGNATLIRVNRSDIKIGDGPSAPTETKGRSRTEFKNCTPTGT
jgi:hypothetical protein